MTGFTGCTLAACWFVLTAACAAQEPGDSKPPDPAQEMMRTFEANGLRVDPKAKSVAISCEVIQPPDPIEFLLIDPRGKSHEALFVTKCKGSVLNAAFLLLGYQKGANARVVDRDPPPTPEEIEKGAPLFDILPPEGERVWFTARWKRVDEDGKEVTVEVPVEDLILDLTTGRAVEGADWIYLGGNMAPIYRNEDPVFVADFEGNLVSVVYKEPPNHLVTMRHPLAADDTVWWFTELMPATGTAAELIAHRERTALHVAREKRLAEERAEREKKNEGEQPDSPDDDEPRGDDEPR